MDIYDVDNNISVKSKIDLNTPLEKIKEYIFMSFEIPINIPKFLNVFIKYSGNKKSYNFNNLKQYIMVLKSEIPIENKLIFTDSLDNKYFLYRKKKYYITPDIISYKYSPYRTLIELLDDIIVNENTIFYDNPMELIESKRIYFNNLITQIYNDYKSEGIYSFFINRENTEPIFNKYRSKGFLDIDESDIIFIFEYLLFFVLRQEKDNSMIQMLEMSGISLDDIKNNIDQILKDYKTLQLKLRKQESSLFKISIEQYSNIINYIEKKNVLSMALIGINGDQENPYINMEYVFKNFPLNQKIPYIGMGNNIKIYKDFEDKKQIKEWGIKKIENNVSILKKHKGITFKIEQDSNSENHKYNNAVLFPSGKIILYNTWTLESNFYPRGNNYMKDFFDNINYLSSIINKMVGSFYNEPYRIIDIQKSDKKIYNITAYGILKIPFDYDNIINIIKKNPVLAILNVSLIKKINKEKEKERSKNYITITTSLEGVKQFTIFLKKNPTYENSTSIEISNISSLTRCYYVFKLLNLIPYFYYSSNNIREEIPLIFKEKREINSKSIRSQNIQISGRDCQSIRQPKISDDIETPLESHEIVYKGKRIACKNREYAFPGFTTKGSICCFKKDQKNNPKFLKYYKEENEILIRPSNLKYKNRPIVLQYGKLHYIDENSKLQEIISESFINSVMNRESQINNANNRTFFGKEVSLNRLLTLTKCDDNLPYLYYDENGYPHCYEIITEYKSYDRDLINNIDTESYIIKKHKVLSSDRLGSLPDKINNLFNNVIKYHQNISKDAMFYRYGIVQNSESFLNAISFLLDISINEIKKSIINSLTNELFLSENNGETAKIFNNNLQNYISFINNPKEIKNHKNIWDIISYALDINILIFDYLSDTIFCKNNIFEDISDKALILLISVEPNKYEPIILIYNNKPIKIFDEETFIADLYQFICIKPFEIINKIKTLIKQNKIKSQIVNKDNKLIYLVSKRGLLIPFLGKTGPISNIPHSELKDSKLSLNDTLRLSNIYDKSKFGPLKIIGQIINEKENTIAIKTSNNRIIPVLESPKVNNLPILPDNYYEIDLIQSQSNKMKSFIFIKELIELIYQTILYEINFIIKNDEIIKKTVFEIINREYYSQNNKIETISNDIIDNIILKNIYFTEEKIDLEKYFNLLFNKTSACIKNFALQCNKQCILRNNKCMLKIPLYIDLPDFSKKNPYNIKNYVKSRLLVDLISIKNKEILFGENPNIQYQEIYFNPRTTEVILTDINQMIDFIESK